MAEKGTFTKNLEELLPIDHVASIELS